jgi:transcriptional regulator with XRE-family HTH domain
MLEDQHRMQQVDNLIKLLRKGDAISLVKLRNQLGRERHDLALEMGVSENKLELWENGEEQPPGLHSALWKIKLSSYIDEKISIFLGTEDNEITHKYWALVWDLVG